MKTWSLSPGSNVLISHRTDKLYQAFSYQQHQQKKDREKDAEVEPGTRSGERQMASDGDAPGSGARYPWRRQPMPPRSPSNVVVTLNAENPPPDKVYDAFLENAPV